MSLIRTIIKQLLSLFLAVSFTYSATANEALFCASCGGQEYFSDLQKLNGSIKFVTSKNNKPVIQARVNQLGWECPAGWWNAQDGYCYLTQVLERFPSNNGFCPEGFIFDKGKQCLSEKSSSYNQPH